MEVNKYLSAKAEEETFIKEGGMIQNVSRVFSKEERGRRAGKQPVVSVIIMVIIPSLDLHNGNVRIYQRANVAVIPRGSRYIWHLGKPLTRFMDI